MDDLTLNKAVAEKLGAGPVKFWWDDSSRIQANVDGEYQLVDYCNNWQDAGPIIFKYRISLIATINEKIGMDDEEVWQAIDKRFSGFTSVIDKNPLKAAMLCFLEMEIQPEVHKSS